MDDQSDHFLLASGWSASTVCHIYNYLVSQGLQQNSLIIPSSDHREKPHYIVIIHGRDMRKFSNWRHIWLLAIIFLLNIATKIRYITQRGSPVGYKPCATEFSFRKCAPDAPPPHLLSTFWHFIIYIYTYLISYMYLNCFLLVHISTFDNNIKKNN